MTSIAALPTLLISTDATPAKGSGGAEPGFAPVLASLLAVPDPALAASIPGLTARRAIGSRVPPPGIALPIESVMEGESQDSIEVGVATDGAGQVRRLRSPSAPASTSPHPLDAAMEGSARPAVDVVPASIAERPLGQADLPGARRWIVSTPREPEVSADIAAANDPLLPAPAAPPPLEANAVRPPVMAAVPGIPTDERLPPLPPRKAVEASAAPAHAAHVRSDTAAPRPPRFAAAAMPLQASETPKAKSVNTTVVPVPTEPPSPSADAVVTEAPIAAASVLTVAEPAITITSPPPPPDAPLNLPAAASSGLVPTSPAPFANVFAAPPAIVDAPSAPSQRGAAIARGDTVRPTLGSLRRHEPAVAAFDIGAETAPRPDPVAPVVPGQSYDPKILPADPAIATLVTSADTVPIAAGRTAAPGRSGTVAAGLPASNPAAAPVAIAERQDRFTFAPQAGFIATTTSVTSTLPTNAAPSAVSATQATASPPAETARAAVPAAVRVEAAAAVAAILPAIHAFGAALHRAVTAERRPALSLREPELQAVAAPVSFTATPAEAAPVDTSRPAWPQAMVAQIERLRDAHNEVDTRIRLLPDALGPVEVTLRRDAQTGGGAVHVELRAADPATRALLAEAQPRLHELAESRGLRLTGDAASPAGGGGSPPNYGQGGSDRRQPAAPSITPRRAAETATEAAADTRLA